MVVQLHPDDGIADRGGAVVTARVAEPPDGRRPHVSGDLPGLLEAGPMFRRAVGGYDRFQVDTYVRWAEDELATAERERAHLLTRQLRTQAALDEATQLLSHSPGGGEFLQLSRRIGSMLAAAADEAEGMRDQAAADRAAAAAEVEQLVAGAQRLLADAQVRVDQAAAEADRVVAAAAAESERVAAEAGRVLAAAERTGSEARAEARARLDEVRCVEQRAAEHAERIRRQAGAEASATLLRARDEVVRMLDTAREERRRADTAAAAERDHLDREAAARAASLLADVVALEADVSRLEHRRDALRTEVDLLAAATTGTTGDPLEVRLRRLRERFLGRVSGRSGPLRAP